MPTTKKPKFAHAEILAILDRSGSMAGRESDTIGGFNGFLKQQQELPGTANLTLVLFDDKYEVAVMAAAIEKVKPLNSETYFTRGSTALVDAMGKSISQLRERSRAMDKKIVVVITDGQENASREWTSPRLRELTDKCQSDGWHFIYLGANQDAFGVAQQTLGINPYLASNSVNTFVASGVGVRSVYTASSTMSESYRTVADAMDWDKAKKFATQIVDDASKVS